ncbi:tRNA (adenosine(37)-N6)-threonylcarbamoyltransferase complex dimerization subunit type 1 TsaB [uncultured Erythrobacter sp.]|uniref:tRNA (adenosine(37)-N6)-threonylcarbamoyltransferase complex dimerization subunit type 1 TsaB n=1 Tax=uncultured Erythrobacter sp. TaxID=263913 RepID=UPI0026242514|nr:tRNA (adenosine(37)-N6)-threonylcarbamoyltransferase complex dimerization subunit type 1 TsaB [uncultured Erythrobacter sp.]
MRILAIETASEACSVALFDEKRLIANTHAELGRGHAERLIPMIADLPGKGRAERIIVSLGPGSFTGVRIGIAAARALGVAWSAQVLGYSTLALVAMRAWQPSPRDVTVCMNGGHGEWFVQNFNGSKAQDELRSLSPDAAKLACCHDVIVGNRADALAAFFSDESKTALNLLPDASKTNLFCEDQFTTNLTPIYGRAPDAKPLAIPLGKERA